MASNYTHVKNFSEFLGIDLKSSDITRPRQFFSGGKNVMLTNRTGIVKRFGYQYKSGEVGGNGLETYVRINQETGAEEPEIVAISDRLHRLVVSSFDVSYGGASDDVIFSLFYDSVLGVFRCTIEIDGVLTLDSDLGHGVDESPIKTIGDLAAEISLLPGFSVTVNGDNTAPAAFSEITRARSIQAGETESFEYMYEEEVNKTVSSPLAGSLSSRSLPEYENASTVNLNGVLYVGNGYDEIHKYDGQTFYRAGLPKGTAPSVTLVPGAITDTSIVWSHTYTQVDAAGQFIEGEMSEDSGGYSPAGENANVVLVNLEDDSGFNTNCAISTASQVSVNTITVDDGLGGPHTLKVGDTAYFYDGASAVYVEREVLAVAANSITIDGLPVDIANDAVISNNLRIALYRTTASGFTKYLVAEIPNNSFTPNQTYADGLPSASLGEEFIDPIYPPNLPPRGKYVTTYRNLLIISGQPLAPNLVSFSDEPNIEAFPAATHAFSFKTLNGQVITGVGGNNEHLCVFKRNAIASAAGDLTNLNFRVEQITAGGIGCVAHATIQEVGEGILYFLSERGPYQIVGGQLPNPVGAVRMASGVMSSRIEPYFTARGQTIDKVPILKRATAIYHSENNHYLLFIPCEDGDGTAEANNNSIIWAYDTSKGAWLPQWENMDASGGLAILNGRLFWSERGFSAFYGDTRSRLAMQLKTSDPFDFADHTDPIKWDVDTHWESLGEPGIFKKFLRMMLYALEEVENDSFTIRLRSEVNYFPGVVSTDMSITSGEGGSYGYGYGPWGEFPWGNPSEPEKKVKLKSDHAKSMRFRFSNDEIHRNVIITGYELECVAPFKEFKE